MSLLAYNSELEWPNSGKTFNDPTMPESSPPVTISNKPVLQTTSSAHGRYKVTIPVEFNWADCDQPEFVVEKAINQLLTIMMGIQENYRGSGNTTVI